MHSREALVKTRQKSEPEMKNNKQEIGGPWYPKVRVFVSGPQYKGRAFFSEFPRTHPPLVTPRSIPSAAPHNRVVHVRSSRSPDTKTRRTAYAHGSSPSRLFKTTSVGDGQPTELPRKTTSIHFHLAPPTPRVYWLGYHPASSAPYRTARLSPNPLVYSTISGG